MIELTAGKDDDDRRLDRILRKALPDLSLSLIHRLLRQKKILVDNKPATSNYRIKQGMVIKVNAVVTSMSNKVNENNVNHDKLMVNNNLEPTLHCSLLPVPILWQGSGIIVFNKPQGLSTHGPKSLDSIVNAWLSAGGAGGQGPLPRSLSFKPGPLHRLDKPTSGAIAFSQTLEGARLFTSLLREHKLEKTYIAIVEGCITREKGKGKSEKSKYNEIIWRDSLEHDKDKRKSFVKTDPLVPSPQGGIATPPVPKLAITTVKTLASNGKYSLIEASIITGRHHQIRAQAASHGHPLAGDIKYGGHVLPGSGKTRGGCFWLHAWKIRFIEKPEAGEITGRFPHEIVAPLPEAFQAQIEELF
jgi:23S rRNA pseudouridine955/2504/2580 synthase